jgi:hypothetical protein
MRPRLKIRRAPGSSRKAAAPNPKVEGSGVDEASGLDAATKLKPASEKGAWL